MSNEAKIFATLVIEGKGEYQICEPTFDVYAKAIQRLQVNAGDLNHVQAGKIIFDSCYIGNNGPLEEIISDTVLHVSLCFKASNLIDVFAVELKKK